MYMFDRKRDVIIVEKVENKKFFVGNYKKEEKKQIVDFNFFFFFCLKFKLGRVQKMIKFMVLLIIGMNMGVKGCCLNMWPCSWLEECPGCTPDWPFSCWDWLIVLAHPGD